MNKIISFSLLQIVVSFFLKINAQTCQNPYIACASLNNNTLTQCGTSFTYAATTLNNPCVQGFANTNFGCGNVVGNPQNQNWIVITVTSGNGEQLDFEFTNSNNQNINGVLWGPVSNDLSRACFYTTGLPTSCDFDAGNPNLRIYAARTGETYILMLSNHSGGATNINITQPTGGGTVNFCRYIPNDLDCPKPTATILSNQTVLAGNEARTEIRFTGTPPFYYAFGDASYIYESRQSYAFLTGYPSTSSQLKMVSVHNSCGSGTILNGEFYWKVLEKDTALLSCYQFNGNTLDGVSANEATVEGAILTNDRNGIPNQAYSFDGMDDVISMNARDYPAEQYTLAAWVKIDDLPNNGSIQKILSIGADDFEQYIGVANNSQTGNQAGWIIGGKFYNGAAPSTSYAATANQWVHICSVKTIDSLKLYINGNLVRRVYQGSFPQYSHNPRARIGGSVNFREYFKGMIDDVKIFSGALKDKHIRDLFNSTDCTFRLCDAIPMATFSPEVVILKNDKYLNFINARLTGEPFFWTSIGNEMPSKRYFSDNEGFYQSFSVSSDSSKIKYYKLSYFSGRCGTGIQTNQMKVVFTPIITSCFSFNGNTLNEASPKHGYTSASFTSDRFGNPNKALSFNGSSSVNLADANSKVTSGAYSISAWINLSSSPNLRPMTIFGGSSTRVDHSLMISKQANSNSITLRFQTNENNFLEEPIDIQLNQWVHVAVTKIQGKILLYMNGQVIKIGSINQDDDWFGYSSIGGNTGGYFNGFIGKIDDVKVFTGTLSDAQMFEVYQSQDCDYRPCNEKPSGNLVSASDVRYDESSNIQLGFQGAGEWTYTLDNGLTNTMFSSSERNAVLNYSPINNSTTVLKLTSVQNACGYGEAKGKVALNVIPKTQNCYLLNNNGVNALGSYAGTLYGTTSTSDRFGNPNTAFEFNGISSFIDIPITGLLNPEYSISIWVMPYNQIRGVSKVISLGTQSQNQKLTYYFDNIQNSWIWEFSSSTNQTSSTIKSSRGNTQNQWHHIVLTRNNQKQQLYIDGALVAENLVSDFPTYGYPSCIFIGKGHDYADAFVGKIDEVRFLKGVLNASEIRNIYNSSTSSCNFTACPNLKISEENINGTKLVESGKTISSNSVISPNANVTFDSGNEIILNPGFKVDNNSVFKAIIDGCGNNN